MLYQIAKLILPSLLWIRADLHKELSEFEDESCAASATEESTSADNFLQSRLLNNPKMRFRITAEGDEEESVTLLNLEDEEGMFRRSVARARSFKGHTFLLRRVIAALEYNETDAKPRRKRRLSKKGKARPKKDVHGKSLEKIVDGFIDSQSESTDACHSQLFEARHQLNQLHDIVIQLARQVNQTEEMIVVFDKSLQDKLKELEDLEKWKVVELEKCQKKKEEAMEMFRKLSIEMEEMRQIASPDVSMDVKGRIIHDLSFLQDALGKHMDLHNETKPLRGSLGNVGQPLTSTTKAAKGSSPPKRSIKEDVKKFSGLVAETTKASMNFLACKKMAQLGKKPRRRKKNKKTGNGGCSKNAEVSVTVGDVEKSISPFSGLKDKMKDTYRCSKVNSGYHGVVWLTCSKGELTADVERCFKRGGGGPYEVDGGEQEEEGGDKSSQECLKQKEELEKVYVKAFVELSRLKTEYDELANSTACFDATNSAYKARRAPIQDEADKLASKIAGKIKDLESLKPRLESATNAEALLRKQVKTLSNQCKDLGPTISDLDKVRDAIRALSECPGLARAKFSLPKWTGEWVRVRQKATGQSDDDLDEKMNKACAKAEKGTRAAEVGEIEEATVLGIPLKNSGPVPLMGTCPNCEGREDKERKSGHLRKCWRTGKPLTVKSRSDTCGEGDRVVLCVNDNPDIREIPGEKL